MTMEQKLQQQLSQKDLQIISTNQSMTEIDLRLIEMEGRTSNGTL